MTTSTTPWPHEIPLQMWRSWLSLFSPTTVLSHLVDLNDLVDISVSGPTVNMFAPGDRNVEAEVFATVARAGSQLGILADAVLEVAEKTGADTGVEVKRLKAMVKRVDAVKRENAAKRARASLEQLKKSDPDGFDAEVSRILTELG